MTLFVVHEADGQISQANKVYSPEGYHELLEDRGLSYVAVPDRGLIRPGHFYVDKGELLDRPDLTTIIDKRKIKAGGDDSALITGIPRKAKIGVWAVGQLLHEVTDTDQLEISIPVPCTYTVKIDLWPYKTWSTDIEAV